MESALADRVVKLDAEEAHEAIHGTVPDTLFSWQTGAAIAVALLTDDDRRALVGRSGGGTALSAALRASAGADSADASIGGAADPYSQPAASTARVSVEDKRTIN